MTQNRKYWMTKLLAGPVEGDGQERWERWEYDLTKNFPASFLTFALSISRPRLFLPSSILCYLVLSASRETRDNAASASRLLQSGGKWRLD